MPDSLARHKSPAALILVDVINHFEFPDGQRILRQALPIAPRLARLKERARKTGIPCIYVNDNFGQWRSDAAKLVTYCLRPESAGANSSMHSAFFQTPLKFSCAIGCHQPDPVRPSPSDQQLYRLHGPRCEHAGVPAVCAVRLFGGALAPRAPAGHRAYKGDGRRPGHDGGEAASRRFEGGPALGSRTSCGPDRLSAGETEWKRTPV